MVGMRWSTVCWASSLAALVLCGCDKGAEQTAVPEPAPAPITAAQPEPTPPPTDEVDDEDLDDGSNEADDEGESRDAGLDPVEAWNNAESAAAEALGAQAFVLTPALPNAWPPEPGSVVYLAYPLDPMETGVNTYRLGRASLKVTLAVADGSTQSESLNPKGKALGRIELDRGLTAGDPVRKAERALLTIAAGDKTAEEVKFALYSYDKWLDDHALIGADVRKRQPEFSKFLVGLSK